MNAVAKLFASELIQSLVDARGIDWWRSASRAARLAATTSRSPGRRRLRRR
ncbi:MAG: hypothetical protein U1F77_12340 [Kiritimatiellia bacterium]